VILPLTRYLVPERGGLAMVFSRDEGAREIVEAACREEGIGVAEWREVPVEPDALGPHARTLMPAVEQAILVGPDLDEDALEWRAYRARRRAEKASGRDLLYVVSLSFRTVTYKALCAADELAHFYTDLRDPSHEVPFGIFHQRFSTNTLPTWERAQPFRLLCHNGEINAIQGNINWMRAREGRFGSTDDELLHPVLDADGSDSAMLDNALELLVRGGRDIRHAITMLVPPTWDGDAEMERSVKDFYRYHAGLVEPWDGPAGLVYTDGRVVGAALDRNGLRPLRFAICGDGLVVCSSEAGSVDVDGRGSVRRGKLRPGQVLSVDLERGLEYDGEIKRRLAARQPYGTWLADGLVVGSTGEPVEPPHGDPTRRHVLFGYTREELMQIFRPIASHAHEPTYSMGDDTAISPLANRARPLFSYFRQRFAQVTNPPIDHLRERYVFSLRTLLGDRSPILVEGPEAAHGVELESFFLFPDALAHLGFTRLEATFEPGESLEAGVLRLAEAAEAAVRGGGGMLLVTDEGASQTQLPIPILLAVGAVHHRLVATGLRTFATILVASDEPREVHHFACLLGFGAEAICPRLALDTLADMAAKDKIGGDHPSAPEAQVRFKTAIEDGVLKVMSKMGIGDVASYCGAQIFEALGLSSEVVDTAFRGTPCSIGGIGFAELEEDVRQRHTAGFGEKPELENPGYVKFRKGGELHETNPDVVDAAHELAAAHALRGAVRAENRALYDRFSRLVDDREPMELRDLVEPAFVDRPVPLDEVEPAESIVTRFSSGAMSHGALSAEAHELIAIALNRIGAKANSGEGGEDPARFGTERNCRIKQVASGRFGVTPAYAVWADELQIKIAQGSKPGEGGQLPAHKVSEEIARLRHTQPGVALISPPPHHDIYSIEDLAQLIFDLKQVNPRADVSVKLVAEAGVGLVAAGCVKALADVVHIAGADGGTGASPLSSIKNAGAPWELGLAETQQALVANGLRGRVRVRVDGGFKTGRDVVVAALLGADEVSFGTALLLAEGCLMVRTCHVDSCPVGIATQKPELRAKLEATPDMIVAYLLFVADEVRELLASLGLRSFDEAVGRVDLLRRRETGRERAELLDLAHLLLDVRAREESPVRYVGRRPLEPTGHELGDRLAADAGAALERPCHVELAYEITNRDRTVGARLGGAIGRSFGAASPPGTVTATLTGTAGQSFGAFLADGVELLLTGEANDYVGKGMGGGRIVVKPPADDGGDPVLLGNTVLYGATGGELFCAGAAGERFAVRLAGAIAIVEGAGGNACEYMTSGTVVILGETGPNLGAGMSGGEAFVFDPRGVLPLRLNDQLVTASRLEPPDAERLRELVARHVELTASARATDLLHRWEDVTRLFWRIAPKSEVARISSAEEGTVAGKGG
jgi:glutamate synthase (ferredoxin)